MLYWRPCAIKDLLTLIYLLSEKTGFGYEEIMRAPAHEVIGLWGAKKEVLEERAKEQEKQNKTEGQNVPTVASVMSQAKSMQSSKTPSMPRMPSIKR